MKTPNVITFDPEQWAEVDIFQHFYIGTYDFNSDTKKAISGIKNHFRKAQILYQLSVKLAPNLSIDEAELKSKGYTSAVNANEFSAVLEEVFTELYSSVDCTRKVIGSIYHKTRGLPNSTRKFFERIKSGKIGADFPSELKDAIQQAHWYEELRDIRDELTHTDIGKCWTDHETGTFTYMHLGVVRRGKPLIIKDVLNRIPAMIDLINLFLGSIFQFLNRQLRPAIIDQLCGFFFGRAYMRKLSLERPINFDSGVCQAHMWFDQEPGFKCPFSNQCKAYERAKLLATTPECPL